VTTNIKQDCYKHTKEMNSNKSKRNQCYFAN